MILIEHSALYLRDGYRQRNCQACEKNNDADDLIHLERNLRVGRRCNGALKTVADCGRSKDSATSLSALPICSQLLNALAAN